MSVPELPPSSLPEQRRGSRLILKLEMDAQAAERGAQIAHAKHVLDRQQEWMELMTEARLGSDEKFDALEHRVVTKMNAIKEKADSPQVMDTEVADLMQEMTDMRNALSSKHRSYDAWLQRMNRDILTRKHLEIARREHEQRTTEEREEASFLGKMKRLFSPSAAAIPVTAKRGKEVILTTIIDEQEGQAEHIRDRMERLSSLIDETSNGITYLRSKRGMS